MVGGRCGRSWGGWGVRWCSAPSGPVCFGGYLHSMNLVDPAEDIHVLLLFDLFVCLAKGAEGVCLCAYAGLLIADGRGEILSICAVFLFSI